ncbi:MAG: signal peptidase I [Candidatus Shapirobacteria bacterium]
MIKKLSKLGLGLILFLLLLVALATGLSGTKEIAGFRLFSVKSASMFPVLKAGDLIIIKRDNFYAVNDIVTFAREAGADKKDGKTVTHRIVDKSNLGEKIFYITKGDANETADRELVAFENILGKKVFAFPLAGYLISYTQTLPGLLILIVIPGTVIIYSELIKIKTELFSLLDKKKSSKSRIIFMAVILTAYLLRHLGSPSFSYYADSVSLGQFSFSLGDWTRPKSEIISEETLLNSLQFNIDYEASDNNLDYIELWYSYNFGDWQLFAVDIPASLGDFDFTSPEGDGFYRFITVAVDKLGNCEDKDDNSVDDNLELEDLALFLGWDLYEVQVDTQAPYTILSLGEFGDDDWGENRFGLNEQTLSGNFEDTSGSERNWIMGGDGDHRAIDNLGLAGQAEVFGGDYSGLIGWFDSDPAVVGTDYLYQIITLPNTPATLSFWFRVLSEDTVDYDSFTAKVIDEADPSNEEVIIRTGSDELSGWSFDSFWQEVTYSLNSWLGKTVKLWFGVENKDEQAIPLRTYALIDDLRVTNLDNWLTTGKEIEVKANDLGSGVEATYCRINGGSWEECLGIFTPNEAGIGDSQDLNIEYYSIDLAGNLEATESLELKTDNSKSYFGLVLNQISPRPSGSDSGTSGLPLEGEWVELWNNSDADIDADGWVLREKSGAFLPIKAQNSDNNGNLSDGGETLVPPGGWLRAYRNGDSDFNLNDDVDKVELWTDYEGSGGSLVDSFSYGEVLSDDKTWKRNPDGTGAWADPGVDIDFTSLGSGKFRLQVGSLPQKTKQVNYEVLYFSLGVEKGVYGEAKEIKEQNLKKELILGTCSTDGCLNDFIDQNQIFVNLEIIKEAGIEDIHIESSFLFVIK